MQENITIQSSTSELPKVEALIDKISELYKFTDDNYGNVLIAVTEAVNNAIIHGNNNEPAKKVYIDCIISSNTLKFLIKDEGNGFDFSNLPDPTDPINIEKPNGRGVFLMTNLSDSISFNDSGNQVEINFNL